MEILSVADIRAHFSAYLRSAAHGRVVVTRGGKPVRHCCRLTRKKRCKAATSADGRAARAGRRPDAALV